MRLDDPLKRGANGLLGVSQRLLDLGRELRLEQAIQRRFVLRPQIGEREVVAAEESRGRTNRRVWRCARGYISGIGMPKCS